MITNKTEEKTKLGKPIARASQSKMREFADKNGWLVMSSSDEMDVFLTPSNDVRVVHYIDGIAYLREPREAR